MVDASRLKGDPVFGVDSRWSWISAFFCAWVLFLGMATPRISGIFFYGIVETFGITRAEASWPLSLAGTFSVIGGPVAGYMCQRFSCRAVLLACSSLAGIGASLCFFAKSLLFLTISFGCVHGAALCGLFVASNVLVAQHFEKRRATASSIVFTAFGLNSIVLPPLIEFFRTAYGVRGALLLYGAILLNAIPAVIVLRSPPWLKSPKVTQKPPRFDEDGEVNAAVKLIESANGDAYVSEGSAIGNGSCNSRPCPSWNKATSCTAKRLESIVYSCSSSNENPSKLDSAKKIFLRLSIPTTARHFFTLTFLVHALSYAAAVLTVGVFVLIPADLAVDRGLHPSNAVYFLQAFAAADIAFRSVVGVAIDSRTLSYESVMLLGFLVQGLVYEWLVWANTLAQLIVVAAFVGSTYGSRTCLLAPALVKDFGIATLPVIIGGVFFCTGVSLLLRPVLIGYFRDNHGDYTGMLHLLAALNAFFVCVWTFRLLVKRRTKTTMTSRATSDTPA